jgi:TolA-binding protein
MICEYFIGHHDIEEVMNDPARNETRDMVAPMISGFTGRKSHDNEIRKFIQGSLAEDDTDKLINEEIVQIKQEIKDKNLESISAAWIKEWHERKQKETEKKTREIQNFVTGSLQNEIKSPVINNNESYNSHQGRSRVLRYASIAAAAVLVFAFLIKYFIPSGNPDKIFSRYYEPYYAASLATRSATPGGDESLSTALESYKSGNYQLAAAEFSNAQMKMPDTDLPRFYLGVTFIELNNYDRAVRLLESIASQPGEFNKDAKWYLGLVWLKTGYREKAVQCFEDLTRDPGFYTERSEKILRLLKK